MIDRATNGNGNGKRPSGRPRADGKPPQESWKSDKELARDRRYRRFLDIVKARVGCEDCGMRDPRVLDFDHRDPESKRVNISNLRSIEDAIDEMKLCVVRCSNHHRIRTDETRKRSRKVLLQRDMFVEDYMRDDWGTAVERGVRALGGKVRSTDALPNVVTV